MTLDHRERIIKEIPTLFWVSIIFILISYLLWNNVGPVPDNVQQFHIIGLFVVVYFGILQREKKLLELKEAQALCLRDLKIKMRSGEIKQYGRITTLPDACLRKIKNEPESIMCAFGIQGDEPTVIVYSVEPYSGYIMRHTERTHWNARMDPDLEIIIPPTWVDFLQMKNKLGVIDKDLDL